jgi:hypothetical protein
MLGHSHALSGAVTGVATGVLLGMSGPRTAALAGFTAGMARTLLPTASQAAPATSWSRTTSTPARSRTGQPSFGDSAADPRPGA